ncbi:MAG: hypothetical protein ACREEP_18290 [Dongiaceae bacterium]
MTERDPFERDLGRSMEARRAPDALRRRIASIPLDHPRRPRESRLRQWFDAATAPWAASLTAALASLAIGFWLGFSGFVDTTDAGNDEELVSLVFQDIPTTMGDEP